MGRRYQEVVSVPCLLVVTMDWLGVCLIKIVEVTFWKSFREKCHHEILAENYSSHFLPTLFTLLGFLEVSQLAV